MSPPGELDRYLFAEGRHRRLWELLGPRAEPDGSHTFGVWAPHAQSIGVVGDWNYWSDGVDEFERIPGTDLWWASVIEARAGQCYKFALTTASGRRELRADPMARADASKSPKPRAQSPLEAIHRHTEATRRSMAIRSSGSP